MKTSFLDYYKSILSKVRFDKRLFLKEYKKALRSVPAEQHAELRNWISKEKLRMD